MILCLCTKRCLYRKNEANSEQDVRVFQVLFNFLARHPVWSTGSAEGDIAVAATPGPKPQVLKDILFALLYNRSLGAGKNLESRMGVVGFRLDLRWGSLHMQKMADLTREMKQVSVRASVHIKTKLYN